MIVLNSSKTLGIQIVRKIKILSYNS